MEVARALQVFETLGFTKSGQPRHPLMLAYSTKRQAADPSKLSG